MVVGGSIKRPIAPRNAIDNKVENTQVMTFPLMPHSCTWK